MMSKAERLQDQTPKQREIGRAFVVAMMQSRRQGLSKAQALDVALRTAGRKI